MNGLGQPQVLLFHHRPVKAQQAPSLAKNREEDMGAGMPWLSEDVLGACGGQVGLDSKPAVGLGPPLLTGCRGYEHHALTATQLTQWFPLLFL